MVSEYCTKVNNFLQVMVCFILLGVVDPPDVLSVKSGECDESNELQSYG